MGLQGVGHDLVTEHTHNLDPEFKFLTLKSEGLSDVFP